jgi:ABC-type Fe3+-hydroxamate transport system substrate-binding protein
MLFEDQLKRTVSIPSPPQRIVSLVPSQTELLVDLGLEDRIVGVTKFCVHPASLRKTKTIVGGTKNYRFDIIDSLNPDLIIGNKEENDQSGIEKLEARFPVWMSDIATIYDCFEMIQSLGEILQVRDKADKIVQDLKKDFANPSPTKGTAVYLIWNDPIMVAGSNTFINEMLPLAGFENKVLDMRYPEVALAELKALSPQYVLLSSEPFPFKKEHIDYFKSQLPTSKVKIVNGEYFSWYGTRLLNAKTYFGSLLD